MKRTYGHEPILLASSPITQHSLATQPAARRSWRKLTLIAMVIVVVAASATVLLLRNPVASSSNHFLRQLTHSMSFPLYTPSWLPNDWFMDRRSLSVTSEVVTFTVNDSKGQRLVFTEQPRPPQNNLDTFYDQQLSGSTAFKSASGQVTTGQFEGTLLAGISTEQTWVLVRAISAIKQSDFDRIIEGIRPASD